MDPIRTLVADDEEISALTHQRFLENVEGFVLVGRAHGGEELISIVRERPVDLLLLDLRLGDAHGLDLLRLLRRDFHVIDAICVSVDHATETIAEAWRLGAFDYLLKPVTFIRFQETLRAYRHYRRLVQEVDDAPDQDAVDALRPRSSASSMMFLPKNLQRPTMELFLDFFRRHDEAFTAQEVAHHLGLARTTASRYLDFLLHRGFLGVSSCPSGPGRPSLRFRRRADQRTAQNSPGP